MERNKMSTHALTLRITLTLLWLGFSLGCIQDPDSFQTSVPDDLDLSRHDATDLDATDLDADATSPCSECTTDEYCINEECLLPRTCRQMTQWNEDPETGYHLLDPPGDTDDPIEVYCELEADEGAVYTMVRLERDNLTDNQEDYHAACTSIGMEIIVPRTRAHAQAILDFNDDTPPNIVGVYPQSEGAQGLHNWRGRCRGEPCSFYLDDSDSAGCQTDLQPAGNNTTEYALIRRGDGCFFGDWTETLDGAPILQGSVICSPNDAGPPIYERCSDYYLNDSLHNAGPAGISGIYATSDANDGQSLSYCEMQLQGGGWTLITINGTDGRPADFSGNDYPRPGASQYGDLTIAQSNMIALQNGATSAANFSVPAADFFAQSAREFLAFVGGDTTDYITGQLPEGCNFFDGTTICAHDTYTNFTVYNSDGTVLTEEAQACTTGAGLIAGDIYNEFGLHILEGSVVSPDQYHCALGSIPSGNEGIGRIYTTFETSAGTYWNSGVWSFWKSDAQMGQPGFLLIR